MTHESELPDWQATIEMDHLTMVQTTSLTAFQMDLIEVSMTKIMLVKIMVDMTSVCLRSAGQTKTSVRRRNNTCQSGLCASVIGAAAFFEIFRHASPPRGASSSGKQQRDARGNGLCSTMIALLRAD